jgi:hypothetical protein
MMMMLVIELNRHSWIYTQRTILAHLFLLLALFRGLWLRSWQLKLKLESQHGYRRSRTSNDGTENVRFQVSCYHQAQRAPK